MPTDRQEIFGGKSWPDRYTFVPAIRVGDTVYISGTTGTDDEGRITAPDDMLEQTRQIFRKFETLLNSIGGSCDDIVVTTDYYLTPKDYGKTADVRREFFKRNRPTSTGIQVSGLVRKDALIEISAIAIVPSGK